MRIASPLPAVVRPIRVTLTLFSVAGALGAVPSMGAAQTAGVSAALPPKPEFRHHRKIVSAYDSTRDTTTVSVVLDKGKYFLWMQKPRVTVGYQYAGRTPAADLAAEGMLVEFRMQEPQAAETNRLTITGAGGKGGGGGGEVRVEAVASGSRLETHAFTHDHRLTFLVAAEDVARVLGARGVMLEVGGIVVRLKEEQVEAWRDVGWGMGIRGDD